MECEKPKIQLLFFVPTNQTLLPEFPYNQSVILPF